MADSRRNNDRSLLFNPKFLLLCIYAAAYIALRVYGEIVYQQVAVPGRSGGVSMFRMVSANPSLPHWRQQLWRAVFSAAMVVEEELKPVLNVAESAYDQSQQSRAGNGRQVVAQAAETGRSLAPASQQHQYAPQAQPPQQQRQYAIKAEPQYAQAQPQYQPSAKPSGKRQSGKVPKASSRGNPNGLDEGERMIFDPRTMGAQ